MGLEAFSGVAVLSHGQVFENHAVLTENGVVKALVETSAIPTDARRHDFPGLTLAAGLIDAQVNGGGGVLFHQGVDIEALGKMVGAHRASGATALLATLISGSKEDMLHALHITRQFRQKYGGDSSGIIGLHLEGPFLNPERHGIHPEKNILPPDADFIAGLDFTGCGVVMMTIAPEMFQPGEIKKLSAKNIRLAAGHSMADEKALQRGKAEGLTGVTHLFNAMGGPKGGGMSARNPGLSGLALDDPDLWCSLIADGQHVETAMIRLATKAKGKGKIFLVSDAMPPSGEHPPHDFDLMGQKIFVKNGRCEDAGGHLAGSAATLFECFRFAVQQANLPLQEAHAMASLYPAQFLKIEAKQGSLLPGRLANILVLDEKLGLKKVIAGNK
jgi:N-acetylglucosamine-6-phosphate deacetylase